MFGNLHLRGMFFIDCKGRTEHPASSLEEALRRAQGLSLAVSEVVSVKEADGAVRALFVRGRRYPDALSAVRASAHSQCLELIAA